MEGCWFCILLVNPKTLLAREQELLDQLRAHDQAVATATERLQKATVAAVASIVPATRTAPCASTNNDPSIADSDSDSDEFESVASSDDSSTHVETRTTADAHSSVSQPDPNVIRTDVETQAMADANPSAPQPGQNSQTNDLLPNPNITVLPPPAAVSVQYEGTQSGANSEQAGPTSQGGANAATFDPNSPTVLEDGSSKVTQSGTQRVDTMSTEPASGNATIDASAVPAAPTNTVDAAPASSVAQGKTSKNTRPSPKKVDAGCKCAVQ